jgi:hypothetical protein
MKYFVSYVGKKDGHRKIGNTTFEYEAFKKFKNNIKEIERFIQEYFNYDPYVVILNIVKLEE